MKKLLILFCLFLFSGCTVNYNIIIKNDNTVIEKTSINVEKSDKNNKLSDVKKDLLSQYQSILNKDNYIYSFKKNNDKIKVKINKNSNLSQLFIRSLYNELYEDYELFENNNKVYFKTVGNSYIGNLFVTKNYEEGFSFKKDLDKLKINITFEGEVVESNADEINEKTNTYTWIFTKDNFTKGMYFTYKRSSQKSIVSNNEDNNPLLIISIICSLVLIGIIALIIKNKNINKV